MTQLLDLLQKVKDDALPLDMLEKYRDQLIHLHSDMQLSLASIEKEEAMFLAMGGQEETDASRKRRWRATDRGQRGIELNRFVKIVVKECDSLRNRIFAAIR